MADINVITPDGDAKAAAVKPFVQAFAEVFEPLESSRLYVMTDARSGARYVECHIRAERLIGQSTIDVPLDPEEQPEYRANRELVEDHVAYERMKDDAAAGRTFSNLVAEYTTAYDVEHPLKIIGGQHRFSAIREAIAKSVNQYHGVKVYFDLDADQRLDVQLISNTNIAVSSDLLDRMQETLAGPELRNWCQDVGLLSPGKDFADRRERSGPIPVRGARTFIMNYFRGRGIAEKDFNSTDTTPVVCKTGTDLDADWQNLKASNPKWHEDPGLRRAGKEFALLVNAQRAAFAPGPSGKTKKTNVDSAEKANNFAVISSWAFVAGALSANQVRLERHFALKEAKGKDPLNAAALAKGRHKSDPENYRGLGYRTDVKERGRFVEVFYLQAEKGEGITASVVDLGIKKYHAKLGNLEVLAAQGKG